MFKVRIWDLPTRFFHWSLALCVFGLVFTGNWGGNAMVWHFRLGYTVLALVVFRVLWGIFGGYWSRWAQLTLHPLGVWAYLRGHSQTKHHAGHNPLGSWSVVSLLLFLFIQASTGLISDDEIANVGPLSSLVSSQWVSWATTWHKGWGKTILILLTLLHLVAIAWYTLRTKQQLVSAMFRGDKTLHVCVPSSQDSLGSRSLSLAIFSLICLCVYLLVSLGS